MDSFYNLPPEICLQILKSTGNIGDAINLTHASPWVLRVEEANNREATRFFLARYLPDDLVQDALAIIHFPDRSEDESTTPWHAFVRNHLGTWAAKGFPDPRQDDSVDPALIVELYLLSQRMWQFIEDYLSKATCRYLPHANKFLPRLSHPDYSELYFPEQSDHQTGIHVLSVDSLSCEVRERVLRAFLQYELLCKVYGYGTKSVPCCRRKHRSGRSYSRGVAHPARDQGNSFQTWDWGLLRRLAGGPDGPKVADTGSLMCAREYIASLYVALIDVDILIPASAPPSDWNPRPDAIDPGMIHSRCQSVENECYFAQPQGDKFARTMGQMEKSMSVTWAEEWRFVTCPYYRWTWHNELSQTLSSAGFNVLWSSLRLDKSEFKTFFMDLFQELIDDAPIRTLKVPQSTEAPWEVLNTQVRNIRHIGLQRQRAVAFLHDVELPQSQVSISTRDRLESGYKFGTWDRLVDYCAEYELVIHGGGFKGYNSLAGKSSPFWAVTTSHPGLNTAEHVEEE